MPQWWYFWLLFHSGMKMEIIGNWTNHLLHKLSKVTSERALVNRFEHGWRCWRGRWWSRYLTAEHSWSVRYYDLRFTYTIISLNLLNFTRPWPQVSYRWQKLRLTKLSEVIQPTEGRASIGTRVSLIPKLMLLTTGHAMLPSVPQPTPQPSELQLPGSMGLSNNNTDL